MIDPYVQIFIHDPFVKDKDAIDVRTTTVRDNGFNPIWNQVLFKVINKQINIIKNFLFKVFSFDLKNPELTYITFYVMDEVC